MTDQERSHEHDRRNLWVGTCIAYVGASNSSIKDGASRWADKALEEFDKRFKVMPPITIQTKEQEVAEIVEIMNDIIKKAFEESRLTYPMIGFKHKDYEEYKQSLKQPYL